MFGLGLATFCITSVVVRRGTPHALARKLSTMSSGGGDIGGPDDPRRFAPSAERNSGPITELLAAHAPFAAADVDGEEPAPAACLEIASGTGQHAAALAARFPHVTLQPTEYGGGSAGPEAPAHESLDPVFASIAAYTRGLPNVRPPIELDAAAAEWPAVVRTLGPACVSGWGVFQCLRHQMGVNMAGGKAVPNHQPPVSSGAPYLMTPSYVRPLRPGRGCAL